MVSGSGEPLHRDRHESEKRRKSKKKRLDAEAVRLTGELGPGAVHSGTVSHGCRNEQNSRSALVPPGSGPEFGPCGL